MNINTPELCDLYLNELMIAESSLKSYGGKSSFYGPITTVKIHDNHNEKFMEAIESASPGSIIVLDGDRSEPCAWMGDRKAGIALKRGISGIIINGFVRDIDGLASLDMGVLALGAHPRASRFTTKKEKEGERDILLKFGQVDWIPGHFVYADKSGVVISKQNYMNRGD